MRDWLNRAWRPTLAWALVLIWMSVIFALSSQPSFPFQAEPVLYLVARKMAHFLEFAILGSMLVIALRASGASRRPASLWALGVAGAYAISDELHQAIVPQRTPSALDVGIDVAGAVVSIQIARLWEARRQQRRD